MKNKIISYKELLDRKEVSLKRSSIKNTFNNKRILVTGAGGSIGSELVRQCLNFKPSKLICIDYSEEKIFDLYQKNTGTIIKPILADINNYNELEELYSKYRPQIVLHAAAYKHVPIQEDFPWNAVITNIGGTKNNIFLSDKYLVKKFVLVSTDKAVNPVSVMGATKRIAEKIILNFNLKSKTSFKAVRFGNVLGSSGSVIPIFQEQINAGGPVTITHPKMSRYFMSIEEASNLILQCCSLGKNREIFVLEMGSPVNVFQMAKKLIRLCGFQPESDIPIIFTGIRKGEKLNEELSMKEEEVIYTSNKKIMILKNTKKDLDIKNFTKSLSEILMAAEKFDSVKIKRLLKKMVGSYKNKIP